MRWLKVPEAAKEWAGGVSPKTMYGAIRDGKLTAARIGAGRNLLVCEQHVDEWLMRAAKVAPGDNPIALRPRGAA